MTTNSPNPVDGDVQALIYRCKDAVAHLSQMVEAGIRGGRYSVTEYRYQLMINKIALSALEAEPEYNTSCEGGEIFLDVSKAEYDKCHEDYRWISYPAPPAQPLRQVELSDCDYGAVSHMSGGSKDYCNGFVDGTNNAIKAIREAGYEVKS